MGAYLPGVEYGTEVCKVDLDAHADPTTRETADADPLALTNVVREPTPSNPAFPTGGGLASARFRLCSKLCSGASLIDVVDASL